MPSGLLKSEALKYGLVGGLLGATAPALYSFLNFHLFYNQLTFADYVRTIVIDSPSGLWDVGI